METLEELALIIRRDNARGRAAREALGLRWVSGPFFETPSRRLASDYERTSTAKWRQLRRDEA